jgi:hypothetical protein
MNANLALIAPQPHHIGLAIALPICLPTLEQVVVGGGAGGAGGVAVAGLTIALGLQQGIPPKAGGASLTVEAGGVEDALLALAGDSGERK